MPPPRVGVIGLGAMGLPMARRLLAAGFPVVATRHHDPHAPAILAAAGGGIVETPVALAPLVDVVVLMLPSSREVEAVVTGEGGLEAAMAPEQVLVDMGTSDPASTRRLAARLAARGVSLVDAPVSGGVKGATDGTLVIMAGGPPEVVARVRPILDAVGRHVVHAGPTGAGHSLKLVNNLVALTTMAVLVEAIRLARAAGLALPVVVEALQHGSADSAMLRTLAQRLQAQRFDPGFRIRLAHKDLALAEQLGDALGVRLPLGTGARQLLQAAIADGLGDLDTSALASDSPARQGLNRPRGPAPHPG
ncbi:MAG: NAD(P)-dependent oxidoreductase [Armatimonadota bacterium]|nr:NAD(P)-dependent oxidoreductase [Armatimonadota bacterium]